MSGLFNGLLVLLFLVHGGCSNEVMEGEDKEITCKPSDTGNTVWWFRLKDNAEMEFITSSKSLDTSSKFSKEKIRTNILTLKKFKKGTDSGFYSCVLINNNKLHFGPVTRLQGKPDPKPKQIPATTVTPQNISSKKPTVFCGHEDQAAKNVDRAVRLGCELVILIPLAVGSGLLLLLIIITILYCNRIRTRRCPHHYKRQPRNRPPGHRPLPNHPEFQHQLL